MSPSSAARPAIRPVVPAVLADRVARRGGKRSVQLQWHERACTVSGTAVQMRVPLVGRVDADLAMRLSAHLEREWVGRSVAEGREITSVAAVTGQVAGVQTLILFLSVDRMPAHRRIDDSRMARELHQAIEHCTLNR